MLSDGVKQTWLDVGHLRIHCLVAGETGSPIILLHGAGVDSAKLSWSASIGPLSAVYQVFAPDLPGYGHSDKPDVAYTMEYYIDFVQQLLNVLQIEKCSFIGLSLGGGIALGFALRFPRKVEKLVLVDSYGIMSKYPWHKLSYFYVHTPLNELSYWLFGRSRNLIRWSLLSGAFYDARRLSQEIVDDVYQAAQDPSAGKAFISFQRSEYMWNRVRTDFSNRLHEITVPILIVNGSEDKLVPVSTARNAHKLINNSDLYILSGCAHWSQREKPDEFNRLVMGFLGQC